MQLANRSYRAGGHPTPYVAIGTHGDFEKVLGCQPIPTLEPYR